MSCLLNILICSLYVISAYGFSEESIFEDEDIYNQALPPVPHTGITAPGTKWCGPGNTAANYDDLGKQRETDKCCRDHDHCSDIIEAATSMHGLNNTDWFPILKCSCEQAFINCLQTNNNMVSNTLGRVYYGTRKKCFGKGYPIGACKVYQKGTFRKRCIRYSVDQTRPKTWQFYDMPFYSSNGAALSSESDESDE